MIKGLQERLHLTKFVSDEALTAVKKVGLEGLKMGGERKVATIMETDIRGFTSMSEKMEPEEVVSLLNTYLDKQTEVIQSYGGDIDKFIGDAVLAVFTGEEMADNAVQCAIEIQKEINKSVNKIRTDLKGPTDEFDNFHKLPMIPLHKQNIKEPLGGAQYRKSQRLCSLYS